MALVYAADVMGDNRAYVKKRGDAFNKADAEKLFGVDDPQQLLDDGVICVDSALPENADEHRSLSYYEMEAAEAARADKENTAKAEKAAADAK